MTPYNSFKHFPAILKSFQIIICKFKIAPDEKQTLANDLAYDFCDKKRTDLEKIELDPDIKNKMGYISKCCKNFLMDELRKKTAKNKGLKKYSAVVCKTSTTCQPVEYNNILDIIQKEYPLGYAFIQAYNKTQSYLEAMKILGFSKNTNNKCIEIRKNLLKYLEL